jgi:hypothetical protein
MKISKLFAGFNRGTCESFLGGVRVLDSYRGVPLNLSKRNPPFNLSTLRLQLVQEFNENGTVGPLTILMVV